ncbi:hypothetical protein [Leptospira santarosai]|uniref:hypothetical protein n=1 Tax=Leptospira santarosai TaxID=28183 RepID=UPI0002FFDF8A|nr:hypothetical protein [Leptospira santarosai]MBW9230937.1 hypothetical protein [Leptospira santarosai]MDI7165627.1 hypothetical protein [Leptospira santarosai]MDI7196073.1 hypothetical protein [Leptospira santarosai]MDI7234739.1 hypothetical protein [Leptospira santarosai]
MLNSNRIQNICPFLVDIFTFTELKDSVYRGYNHFLNNNKKYLTEFANFIGKLHDSKIISIFSDKSDFCILLNDTQLAEKANCQLTSYSKNINELIYEFPILLRFKNTSFVRIYTVSEKGFLKRRKKQELNNRFTYLYEQIIEANDKKIALGIILFDDKKRLSKNRYRLLIIESKKIEVSEQHEVIWRKLFGENSFIEYQKYRFEFPTFKSENGA